MANKIINNGDWFLVEIIEKYEPIATDKTKELRRVTTYGNYHLINATTPSQAYDKAVKIGKTSNYKFTNSHKLNKSEFPGRIWGPRAIENNQNWRNTWFYYDWGQNPRRPR